MKLIHISDLHIGKAVNKFSMIDDQKYILGEILNVIDREKPDGVLIAGDVYDRDQPSAAAVTLFNDFLEGLAERKLEVFIISGNHDSAERIAFAHKLLDATGIHLSPVYDGRVASFTLHKGKADETAVYLLPFIKPAHVRVYYPQETITSYSDALKVAIDKMNVDTGKTNVLLAHQFVTGAIRSDSEEVFVGGLDNVDVSVFEPFDYVALGHLHGPQKVGRDTVCYAGSPLKYSFSEADQKKSVTIIEIESKGKLSIRSEKLIPLRDLKKIRGSYNEIMTKSYYEAENISECYVQITLTDEDDIPDAIAKLRTVYPYLMELGYDNARTNSNASVQKLDKIEHLTPQGIFREFYTLMNGRKPDEEREKIVYEIVKKIWEDKK